MRIVTGTGFALGEIYDDGLVLPKMTMRENEVAKFRVLDTLGFVYLDVEYTDPNASSGTDSGSAEIAELNASNIAYAEAVRTQYNPSIARPTRRYNHVIVNGQSRGMGNEAHPALSKKIGRAVQQECRDRSRMPSSA
eukprot:TRINITY_DN58369_c0_g1_i1.p2 TRINITY_DN58369_c0_g1~~TRINITY_DN58369_c0_g1_i1.p2  ORF type:complete len:155 (+),score=34.47 TRINITY_DN58369_c0_g1_i1:57-467(+)